MSPGITTTFRSLKVRNYRLFASGQVISLSGTWAQRVAQDWLGLELSHNSGVALGITTGLQFLPILLFSPYAGLVADRMPIRLDPKNPDVVFVGHSVSAMIGALAGLAWWARSPSACHASSRSRRTPFITSARA